MPSPTLLIRAGSHTAAGIQSSPSGSTNGPSDGLKVLLVKELWLVSRRGETSGIISWEGNLEETGKGEATKWETALQLRGGVSEGCVGRPASDFLSATFRRDHKGQGAYLHGPWWAQQLTATDSYCRNHSVHMSDRRGWVYLSLVKQIPSVNRCKL